MLLEPEEFSEKLNILSDEVATLKWKEPYEIPEANDPLFLFFDDLYLLGAAVTFPSHLIFNIGTGGEDWQQDIKSACIPYDKVGTIESEWTPLAGVEPSSWSEELPVLAKESAAMGKPWTARLDIKMAKLPVRCYKAYIQYDFFGTSYCTEVVKQRSSNPFFNYTFIHHVDVVTPEFVAFLNEPFEFNVYANPFVEIPNQEKLGTANPIVMESIRTGVPQGYNRAAVAAPAAAMAAVPATTASSVAVASGNAADLAAAEAEIKRLKQRVKELEGETASSVPVASGNAADLAAAEAEIKRLKQRVKELEGETASSVPVASGNAADLAAAEAEIKRLKQRVKELEGEVEELEDNKSCCYFCCCKKRRDNKIHHK
jgi:cell division protein FtsB